MNQPLRALRHSNVPRPVLNVAVQGLVEGPVLCLLDTGSLQNRFGLWVARQARIDLSEIPAEDIGVGGITVHARTVTVRLRVGAFEWEAPTSFCDPWPWEFNILGQEGFFRWFVVTIDAAERRFEIRR